MPRISWNRVPEYLLAADLLLAPYSASSALSSQWTSPLKILEYMASGTPIVASDLPSVREMLSPENAFLVSPVTPEEFSRAITQALENPNERELRASYAHRAVQAFSWDKRAEKIIEFIQKIP